MKILLITDKETTKEILSFHLTPLGFEFLHYLNPIKAMDNIEEIDPDIVLFSGEDFPRHWKPFLQYLRSFRERDKTIFILLSPEHLEVEEAAKAIFLGVNGIIIEDFSDESRLDQLRRLVSRYKMLNDKRIVPRYVPMSADKMDLVFNHPDSMKLVTGTIKNISFSGASFLPDNPQITLDLTPGKKINHCSLKLGENIISFNASVLRNSNILILDFDSLTDESRDQLSVYLEQSSNRKLESIISTGAS